MYAYNYMPVFDQLKDTAQIGATLRWSPRSSYKVENHKFMIYMQILILKVWLVTAPEIYSRHGFFKAVK